MLDPEALQEIVEGTAAETGEAFFDALVRHLARAIGTKCVWVTEWLPAERRLRALSFWVGEGFHGDFEYVVAGTPCELVVDDRRLVHVPECVLELYPNDPSLEPLGAVSYMGLPLLDTDGRVLGHLAVLHDAPLPEDDRVLAVFRIFAARASAELRRLRRDRDLREREQKLSGLIGSAMDAIVELDEQLEVTHVNAAAETAFLRGGSDLLGQALDALFDAESRGKLAYLAKELERQADTRSSMWILVVERV